MLLWSACGYLIFIRDVAGPQLKTFPPRPAPWNTADPLPMTFDDLTIRENDQNAGKGRLDISKCKIMESIRECLGYDAHDNPPRCHILYVTSRDYR